MHAAARTFVTRFLSRIAPRKLVVEFGSRDVNGSIRNELPKETHYIGIDLIEGPSVDVVADAADWHPDMSAPPTFDTVICMEMLEHTARGADICANAYELLDYGGVMIITAAAPPRQPHSAIDGGAIRTDEHYANVTEDDLRAWLWKFGFVYVEYDAKIGDIYAFAVKTL